MVNQTGTAGTYLVDGQGFAIYGYSKDTQNQPATCTGDCAKDWPPVMITGAAAVAGNGADATKLGVSKNMNGMVQVTYNGWPLYYFDEDTQPGDAKGNGEDGFFLITPAGTPLH